MSLPPSTRSSRTMFHGQVLLPMIRVRSSKLTMNGMVIGGRMVTVTMRPLLSLRTGVLTKMY